MNDIAVVMALPMESQGLFEQHQVPVFYSGIGKVNAAFCATQTILNSKCKLLLNLGTAGSDKFNTHELVECASFVQRDMDISPLGFAIGETPFDDISGAIEVPTFFPELKKAICGTDDQFVTQKPPIACDLVDMEAFALAKVCRRLGVQFVSLKYITDGANHEAHNDWQANLKPGAQKLFEYYQKILKI